MRRGRFSKNGGKEIFNLSLLGGFTFLILSLSMRETSRIGLGIRWKGDDLQRGTGRVSLTGSRVGPLTGSERRRSVTRVTDVGRTTG